MLVVLRPGTWTPLAAVLLASLTAPLRAGLGPENVAVVVNADSEASDQIADEYVRLRQIPACNVIRLTGVPDSESTDVETFRSKLLTPVLSTIEARNLTRQIDCIAWSSAFPTAINIRADLGKRRLPRVLTPVASLNGLTYLHELVLKKDIRYLTLQINGYARHLIPPDGSTPLSPDEMRQVIVAIRTAASEKAWDKATTTLRELIKSHPRNPDLHYNLACCLARTDQAEDSLVALRAAVDAGWWNHRHAERDDDLKALRSRDEFKSALADMTNQHVRIQPSRAFSSRQLWNAQGEPVDTEGMRFLLSTVLAVTRGRGTTVDEALSYLKRSQAADGTRPARTIYYMRNGNIRSTSRDGLFPSAAAMLKTAGVRAVVMDGVLPKGQRDVQGVTVGTAGFDWNSSGSRILPGAICEHFTSFGGVMRANAGQTPLTEFLKHGAAGASGTVTEPYAIPAKFPDPFLHVHYARGYSLAESFYQSVAGPYQLLIVGDPLCQPWARFPEFTVDGIKSEQELAGIVKLTPRATGDVSRFELFVDGRLELACKPGLGLLFDTTTQSDGRHELRVVAVSAEAVESRNRAIFTIIIRNQTKP